MSCAFLAHSGGFALRFVDAEAARWPALRSRCLIVRVQTRSRSRLRLPGALLRLLASTGHSRPPKRQSQTLQPLRPDVILHSCFLRMRLCPTAFHPHASCNARNVGPRFFNHCSPHVGLASWLRRTCAMRQPGIPIDGLHSGTCQLRRTSEFRHPARTVYRPCIKDRFVLLRSYRRWPCNRHNPHARR